MRNLIVGVFLLFLVTFCLSAIQPFAVIEGGINVSGYFVTTDNPCNYEYNSEGICLKVDYNFSNIFCDGVYQNGICVRVKTKLLENNSCEICSLCSSKPSLFGLTSCNEMYCNSLPLCIYSSSKCNSKPVCSLCGNGICDVDENITTCSTDCSLLPCSVDGFCDKACPFGTDPDCGEAICGNGVIEGAEDCDGLISTCGINKICSNCLCVPDCSGDGVCNDECLTGTDPNCGLPVCGNGIIESGEECGEAGLVCGGEETCSSCLCVPDCSGDGECNGECPVGTDPDCVVDPCVSDGVCNPICPLGVDLDCPPTCFGGGVACTGNSNCCSDVCSAGFCLSYPPIPDGQSNSISILEASYNNNLNLVLGCTFDADSDIFVFDVNNELVYFWKKPCLINYKETSINLDLENGQTYSIVSEISSPCQMCRREAFFYVSKESQTTIPDWGVFSLLLILFAVGFVFISSNKKN